MKKQSIINLIKYHCENNDIDFRREASNIALEFDKAGDFQLAQYVSGLIADVNVFLPQFMEDDKSFFRKVQSTNNEPLPLPIPIKDDILGMANAIKLSKGINKFLFQGSPGTGKTESAKQVARLLDRDLFIVDFEQAIDSKLGQTVKNIGEIFDEIKSLRKPEKAIILFDEIDAIAIDRINNNDNREMGRATTSILKGLDSIGEKVVLIATTNLYEHFDKALVRRFDFVINFDRYSIEDLKDIALVIVEYYLNKNKVEGKNTKLLKKIFNQFGTILPYPGELKNILKTCIAFSDSDKNLDYIRRIYKHFDNGSTINNNGATKDNVETLQTLGYTLREIEILTKISKSQVSRELSGVTTKS